MTEPHRTPWWTRKRWIAAAVLWILISYPLSMGPLAYMDGRGWISTAWYPPIQLAYWPFSLGTSPAAPIRAYCDWWFELARRHESSTR